MAFKRFSEFCRQCVSTANLRRALITAAVVGPLLTLINQYPALRRLTTNGEADAMEWLRIALTFAVPFGVSLTSASLAEMKTSQPARIDRR